MPLGLERRHNTGQFHFITVSCHGRQPYLSTPEPKNILEQVIDRTRQSHKFALYAYVLMPEHIHLLLSEPENYTLTLKGTREKFWETRYYDFNTLGSPSHQGRILKTLSVLLNAYPPRRSGAIRSGNQQDQSGL